MADIIIDPSVKFDLGDKAGDGRFPVINKIVQASIKVQARKKNAGNKITSFSLEFDIENAAINEQRITYTEKDWKAQTDQLIHFQFKPLLPGLVQTNEDITILIEKPEPGSNENTFKVSFGITLAGGKIGGGSGVFNLLRKRAESKKKDNEETILDTH